MITKSLQAHLSALFPSVRFFYSRITPDPDTAVFIIQYSGKQPDVKDNYSYPSFQIVSRALIADEAETNIRNVFNVLQNMNQQMIGDVEVIEITAKQSYYQLKIDEKNRVVYAQNYDAHIYESTQNRE